MSELRIDKTILLASFEKRSRFANVESGPDIRRI